MYEIDYARGLAYQGKKGFVIQTSEKGLFIKNGRKEVFLTPKNSKGMEIKNKDKGILIS